MLAISFESAAVQLTLLSVGLREARARHGLQCYVCHDTLLSIAAVLIRQSRLTPILISRFILDLRTVGQSQDSSHGHSYGSTASLDGVLFPHLTTGTLTDNMGQFLQYRPDDSDRDEDETAVRRSIPGDAEADVPEELPADGIPRSDTQEVRDDLNVIVVEKLTRCDRARRSYSDRAVSHWGLHSVRAE